VRCAHPRRRVIVLDVADIDPLLYVAVLEELAAIRRAVAALEYKTVNLVRVSGATWEQIGEALGMSRQAAARKYGRPRKRLI
jgi:hypothetical protein